MDNLISIIVPVYNVEKFLEHCINSVINQTYTNWELILINDGSQDSSPEICNQYALLNEKIKVIHKSNGGLSSARNAGIEVAHGDYITFLDSDDFWHPDYLKTLLSYSVKHNADIVQCNFLRVNSDFSGVKERSLICKLYDNHSVFVQEAANIIVWAKLYKRSLWDNIRIPEGKINEDDFTTWKLYYKSNVIVVITSPLYFYRINPLSIMSKQKKELRLDFTEAYNERILFFKSNGDRILERCSRLQFAKSLFLACSNKNISKEKYSHLRTLFIENWLELKRISGMNFKYIVLFTSFLKIPQLTMWFIRLIR